MAIVYRGYCNSDGSNKAVGALAVFGEIGYIFDSYTTNMGTPAGDQTLKELAVYQEVAAGAFKIALYDSSGNLVCSGGSKSAVTGPGWLAWDNTSLTPVGGSLGDTITLSGSTNYRIGFVQNYNQSKIYYDGGSSGNSKINIVANYAGFPPSTIPAGTAWTALVGLRYGVEAVVVAGQPVIKRFGGVPYCAINKGVW
jgi:hypothetical protein